MIQTKMIRFIQIATLVTLVRNDVAVVRCPALLPQMVTLKTYVCHREAS